MGRGPVRTYVAVVVGVAIAFAVADIILLFRSNVWLSADNLWSLAWLAAVACSGFAAICLVRRRLKGDNSRIAGLITRAADGASLLLKTTVLFAPLSMASALFMYLVSATDRPLVDPQLAGIDAAIGFDWLHFLDKMNSLPLVSATLLFSYHALGPQVPLLFLLLCFRMKEDRIYEFVAMLAISSVFTAAGLAAFPAGGAYVYFDPDPAIYNNFTKFAGMWHYKELLALRSGGAFEFSFARVQGLVTFPSFHTTLGILIVYSLRKDRLLAVAVGILNAVMIVSTLPEGGHHLIDVLAGGGVALLSVSCLRAFASSGIVVADRLAVIGAADAGEE